MLSSRSAHSQPSAAAAKAAQGQPTAYGLLRRRLAWTGLAVACLCALLSPFPLHAWRDAILLTGLVVSVSLLAVRLPSSNLTTYPGIPIIFALVGLLGASAATLAAVICVVADGLISMSPRSRYKLKLYIPNIAAQVITVGLSALLYVALQHFSVSVRRDTGRRDVRVASLPGPAGLFFGGIHGERAADDDAGQLLREKTLGHHLAQ